MSLLFQRRDLGDTPNQLIPTRGGYTQGSAVVTQATALRHSAVWACLRIRADLVSTAPVDTYRQVGNFQVTAPATPFLTDPQGDGSGIEEWLYSTQIDLDRVGNCYGVITARDAAGYPARVELQSHDTVSVLGRGRDITGYRIAGTRYDPADIWHERQFTLPGIPLGLSPIGYAAASIGNYLSAQDFGLEWFGGAGVPKGHLKNTAKTLDPKQSHVAKDRFKAAMTSRDVFVSGADWEFNTLSVAANESQFLETMNYGITDVARFLGVPGDLIDAPVDNGTKITYANITQRHLQLLVIHLGPAFIRREKALSRALPRPRFVKLDTDALLRMDPQSRESMLGSMIANRQIAPSEARAMDNRQPYTEDQLAEFDRLFGKRDPNANPSQQGVPQ